ncbi:MAG: hypothetical protein QOH79_382 [Acidimicrobiaceae bacterium]
MIALAVALAGVWPVYRSVANHSFTAIIGAGVVGPSTPLIAREVPDVVVTPNAGHDGQQFYAVARHPFDPEASAPYLANPVYRYRRIVFPVLGWLFAPTGGTRLIAALLIVGLAGVALGAAAVSFLPGAPKWLPLTVGVTPGVVAALGLTLADSLALGFTLAAFAASARRRPPLVLVALVLAVLTRETALLAAIALAAAPDVSWRWRAAYVAVPAALLGAWVLWVSHVLGIPVNDGAADQFSFPLVGWLHANSEGIGLFIAALLAALLVLGAVRTQDTPAVCAYLGLLLVLFATLSPNVTVSWVNTTRAVIAGLPLAVWGITREAV